MRAFLELPTRKDSSHRGTVTNRPNRGKAHSLMITASWRAQQFSENF